MTKIYSYRPDGDHFEHLLLHYPTIDDALEFHRQFGGTARLASNWAELWKPFAVIVNSERPGPVSDFPMLFVGPPIFSERAWQVLSPLIGAEVEALPIAHPRGPHFAIHVLSIVDALDRERSRIRWSPPDNNYISDVEEHVWKPCAVEGHHMFRIPETADIRVYLSEEFRRLVEANGLKGLEFRETK
jgi:hypothetical protein